MKLRRLARMTVSELLGRSRQEALKRLERAGWATPSPLRADVSLAEVAGGGSSAFLPRGGRSPPPAPSSPDAGPPRTKTSCARLNRSLSSASISSGTGIFPSVIR